MGALADGDFENYSYQGVVAVCLSIITGKCIAAKKFPYQGLGS
jgi:hypothetical protein